MDSSKLTADLSNVIVYESIDADIHRLTREMVQKCQYADDPKLELRYSLGTVMFSFTTIETFLNKITVPKDGWLNEITSKMSLRLYNGFEKMPITERIELLFLLSNKDLNRGSEPFQSIDLLRRLRNFIIHHSPTGEVVSFTDEEPDQVTETKLEKRLSDKFKIGEQENTFLKRCFTKNCAIWSYNLTIDSVEFMCDNFDLNKALFLKQKDN